MGDSDNSPGRTDRVIWTITGLWMAVNEMADLGSAAHDAFRPDHGWAA